jgi:hypothetical protein
MSELTRRTFAATGVTALAAGCASVPAAPPKVTRAFVPPVLVSAERIARVDVGLRPFRPAGFRVEREMLGETAVIHNYGHGGGGISLSWGTAHLAVEEGFDPDIADYAVLGAGVVGLSTALLLLERGARVTLYARELTPNTTSTVAGGQWWPASVYRQSAISAGYMDRHVAASRFAFRRFQLLTGPEYGVGWEVNYALSDYPVTSSPAPADHPMNEFAINVADYAPGELPFNAVHARSFDTMMIDTPHYLRVLERDVRGKGGKIVVRTFSTVRGWVLENCSVTWKSGLCAGNL